MEFRREHLFDQRSAQLQEIKAAIKAAARSSTGRDFQTAYFSQRDGLPRRSQTIRAFNSGTARQSYETSFQVFISGSNGF